MTRRHALIRRLGGNTRAVAAVEFALTAPVFLLILLGIFDFGWQMYAKQVLQGAVAQAGRDAALEIYADDQSALDERVKRQVLRVRSNAAVTFSRQAYDNFSDAAKPPRVDPNTGCVEIAGRDGNGGADDVVVYTVTMRFDRVLPLWAMLGQSQMSTLSASTVLRNQPFANGSDITPEKCPK
jgi:Flp pilus assembly protein TadG